MTALAQPQLVPSRLEATKPTMAATKDIKVTQDSVWVRLSTLVPVIAITASATLIYVRVDSLEKKVDVLSAQMRAADGEQLSVRQFQAWLDRFGDVNIDKFPTLKLPPIPR